jgi:hypothetical protein
MLRRHPTWSFALLCAAFCASAVHAVAEPVAVDPSSRLHHYQQPPLSKTARTNIGWETKRGFGRYVGDLRAGVNMARHLETLPPGAVVVDTGAGEARAMVDYVSDERTVLHVVPVALRRVTEPDPMNPSGRVFEYGSVEVEHNHGLNVVALGLVRPLNKDQALRLRLEQAMAQRKIAYHETDLVSYALAHAGTADASLDYYGGDFYLPPHIALEAQAWLLKPGGRHYFYTTGNAIGLMHYLRRTRGFDLRFEHLPGDEGVELEDYVYLERNGDLPHFPVPVGEERHGNVVFDYDNMK